MYYIFLTPKFKNSNIHHMKMKDFLFKGIKSAPMQLKFPHIIWKGHLEKCRKLRLMFHAYLGPPRWSSKLENGD